MLPQGIFVLEKGGIDAVPGESLEILSRLHPLWKKDVEKIGKYEQFITIDGVGSFLKSTNGCEATIVVVDSCESTMEMARTLAESEILGEWGVVVSALQLGGRGQLRRPWMSTAGNLHISVIMPNSPVNGVWAGKLDSMLPLVAGYVFGGIFREMGANIRLKWPNDLLQDGRKIGGILVEEKNEVIILGLGVNLVECPSDEMMREDSSAQAGVLKISKDQGSPLSLSETLVNRGKIVYSLLLNELEPPQFISLAEKQLAWLGHRVLVREGSQDTYHAEITGLSPDGGLALRCGSKEIVLYSGSVFPL